MASEVGGSSPSPSQGPEAAARVLQTTGLPVVLGGDKLERLLDLLADHLLQYGEVTDRPNRVSQKEAEAIEKALARLRELIEGFLPATVKRLSDALVGALSTLIYAAIAWVTFGVAVKNYRVGSFVEVLGWPLPIWPTYVLPPLGFALAALITAFRAVQNLRSLK